MQVSSCYSESDLTLINASRYRGNDNMNGNAVLGRYSSCHLSVANTSILALHAVHFLILYKVLQGTYTVDGDAYHDDEVISTTG